MRCTVLTLAPDCTASDAAVCRRSWIVMRGNPADFKAEANHDLDPSLDRVRFMYPPVGEGKTSASGRSPAHRDAKACIKKSGTGTRRGLWDFGVPT